jgi:N-acetyl-anhydromuramoyl-L-alanine amidase
MRVNDDHWLTGVRKLVSLNCNDRPDPAAIELVVIHGISLPPGRFGGSYVHDLFTNRLDLGAHESFASLDGVRVSSHLFITRRGAVTQYVPFHRRAWHAGVSAWRRRPGCNDFSIGIELEGTEERPYTASQYKKLRLILDALLARYPRLSTEAIVGHLEVAPGRKTDPGPRFDWPRLLCAR